MSKVIVIGTSLSGKTTLIKYLRSSTSYTISEIDEELTDLNNGIFPMDVKYKHNVLFPIILKNLFQKTEIIFFTNAWYFKHEDIKTAKKNNFKIIQLSVGLDTLLLRNKQRMKKGYEDMTKYLNDMVKYQKEIYESNIVDYVLNGEQTVEKVASDLLEVIEK